jgi:serine O-acetyltransferase
MISELDNLDYTHDDHVVLNYNMFVKNLINDCPFEILHLLNESSLIPIFKKVLLKIVDNHSKLDIKYFSENGRGIYNHLFLDHYLILCYRFAHALYKIGNNELAAVVYYSSRIRCSVDIFYKNEIGDYFIPVHPLGTVISPKSKYGKLFKLYHNVTIGPYNSSKMSPKIGNGVTIYGNSSVLGDSTIGDNVTISTGVVIINRDVPKNSKVLAADNGRIIILPNSENNLTKFFYT